MAATLRTVVRIPHLTPFSPIQVLNLNGAVFVCSGITLSGRDEMVHVSVMGKRLLQALQDLTDEYDEEQEGLLPEDVIARRNVYNFLRTGEPLGEAGLEYFKDILFDLEDFDFYDDPTLRRQWKQALIAYGFASEITDAELANKEVSRGKKYWFKLLGKKYE